MCGFAGFIDPAARRDADSCRTTARAMATALAHRGPDDSGEWVDPAAGVGLGFRRLSIIDLSAAGHQPMHSASGRYVIVFNGEAYNFSRVRAALEQAGKAPPFRGHSDTEVLLAAIEAYGLTEAVRQCVGMFAFALWDRQTRRMHLVRDRLGVKPLYYAVANGEVLFGSELKAFRAHPAFTGEIDRGALALMIRHAYVPAPHTIYRSATKVAPGTIVTFDALSGKVIGEERYWAADAVATAGAADSFGGSDTEAVDELESLLRDAVSLRMISDVPLGVFLSGGVDSSLVAALMQAQHSRPVKTFSIGFHEQQYDEARHAAEVARHIGADHTELYVTPAEALDVIPALPQIYDEPFADSSQIPTYLVSKLARRDVTVALSGDGGDELFGGYNRYVWGPRLWNRMRWAPGPARRAAGAAVSRVAPRSWDAVFDLLRPVLPAALRPRNAGDKMHKVADVLGVRSPDEMYLRLTSQWRAPLELVRTGSEPLTRMTDPVRPALSGWPDRMMYLDMVAYLPDDILVKVDRASMAVSLEAREPLLDHRLVELAWRLPLSMKIRNGEGKWALRQVLYRYVPQKLIERPKMGFGIPLDAWLRGPLRDWAEGLLSEHRLRDGDYFDPRPIRAVWAEHLAGRRNCQHQLWNVLMFQAWREAAQVSG